jgi:hypothetical protein
MLRLGLTLKVGLPAAKMMRTMYNMGLAISCITKRRITADTSDNYDRHTFSQKAYLGWMFSHHWSTTWWAETQDEVKDFCIIPWEGPKTTSHNRGALQWACNNQVQWPDLLLPHCWIETAYWLSCNFYFHDCPTSFPTGTVFLYVC